MKVSVKGLEVRGGSAGMVELEESLTCLVEAAPGPVGVSHSLTVEIIFLVLYQKFG